MSSNKAFAKITKENLDRGCDPMGCGSFGASRGSRKHKGIDIVAKPGETIFSPITGNVNRYPIPYAGDNRYSGIEIENATYRVMIFYMKTTLPIGSVVLAGQPIGTAQDLTLKHGSSMTNHVHLEVYKNGVLIDPTDLFN